MIVIVSDHASRIEKDGTTVAAFENKLAWLPNKSGQMIIAVGGPHEWRSSAPLPPEAVMTDLVITSTTDTELAATLWGPFLAYLYYAARPPPWGRMLMLLSFGLIRVPVRIDITDATIRAAVRLAISQSRYFPRFTVRDGLI